MSDLAAALEWKYGAVADTAGGVITAWRHPTLPQPTDLPALLAEWQAATAPARTQIDKDEAIMRLLLADFQAQGIGPGYAAFRLLYRLVKRFPTGRTADETWFMNRVEAHTATVNAAIAAKQNP